MASSKSMDFPSVKKSSYAAQVEQNQTIPNETSGLSFLPVPGPVGPQGSSGKNGSTGLQGPKGEDGKPGPKGNTGQSGKDGLSSTSSSGQQAGWASYVNSSKKSFKLGATQGDDGWVSIFITSDQKNEEFIPEGCTSLWNANSRLLNFKGLKIGSQVFITYNFEITTYNTNTEVWFRTFFPSNGQEFSQIVGSFKYQNSYDLFVTQQVFIENQAMWGNGAIPQIRTDYDSSVILNSIYVSVV